MISPPACEDAGRKTNEGPREVAQISKSVQAVHGILPHLIAPATVAKISQDELLDRLAFVQELNGQADLAANYVLAGCYRSVAKAALTALPRAEVEQRDRNLRAKAALLGSGPGDLLLQQADELLAQNPVAPRRAAVRKAQAVPCLVPLYDSTGQLYGVADEADITPMTDSAVVAKASGAGMAAVFSKQGKAAGFVHLSAITPVVSGR